MGLGATLSHGFGFSILIFMVSATGHCQESIRMSLAGEQAAAAQKTSTSSNYYNVEAGPAYLRFQGEMGIELNDNANYSSTAPDADMAFHPNLNVKAFWPVTERNTLALSTGIGYMEYIRDRSLSRLNVASDSGLAFNVYSGDFIFDFHDRFSAVDYQVEDPSVSASLIRFENTAGMEAVWDLNKLVLAAGYDHDTFNSLNETYEYSDNEAELLNVKAAMLVSPTGRLGLEAGGGMTSFARRVLDDSAHFSVGPFYQARFTPHLSGEVHAGFASYQFDHDGTVTNVSDFAGYYASASVKHQLNDSFSQSLAAGRKIQLGITAELSDIYFASYQATWLFIRDVFTTFNFTFDHGSTAGGLVETYDQYGPGITLGWHITGKILASATYSFLDKKSDVSRFSYTQNRLLLDTTYDF